MVFDLVLPSQSDIVINGDSAEMICTGTASISQHTTFTLFNFNFVNYGLIECNNNSTFLVAEGQFFQADNASLSLIEIDSREYSALKIRGTARIGGSLKIEIVGNTLDVRLPMIQADEMFERSFLSPPLFLYLDLEHLKK